ncbi:MAG: hypothetical protein ACK53Y_18565, partial [bacterium]
LHGCLDPVLSPYLFGDADQFRGIVDSVPRCFRPNCSIGTVTPHKSMMKKAITSSHHNPNRN